MRRQVLFSVLFLNVLLFGSSQSHAQYWMQKAGGITIDEAADISIDGAGNFYATGYFTSTANFGSFPLNSSGVTDIYLVKLNPTGLYQWAVKAGGTGIDRPVAIKTDAAGNSYVTGFFYGMATFGSFSIISSGVQDIFVAKYNNAGVCQWVTKAGGALSDIGNGITIDNSGNVIVAGEFAGTATFGSTTLTSMNNSVDVFTAKLDGSGNFLWAKKGTAAQYDRALDVAADGSGNIYVTGQFTDTITFDVTHTNNMYNAIFLIKYNSSGAEQWFRVIGGGSMNVANAIATDNNGNILLAGDFQGTLNFFSAPSTTTMTGTYFNRIFVAKYDGSGNKIWSSQSSSASEASAKNLALDASGNPFVIGNFKCKFSSYADVYGQGVFNCVGMQDIFISKWNSAGAWQWARQVGGHSNEYGTGITVNAAGEPVFTASFNQDIIIPVRNTFLGYTTVPTTYCTPSYCSDNYYGLFAIFNTAGNSDVIITKTIDPLREPYDFYRRTPPGCIRDDPGVCINGDSMICPDTVIFCNGGVLTANPQVCPTISPTGYTYVWSNSQTGSSIFALTTGIYSVTQTSADGCNVSTDSVYVIILPLPPAPTISDDVIINTNATNPDPIHLCLPDTVILTGGNFGSASHVWTGPGIPGSTSVSITVTESGTYCFTIVDSNGCWRTACIVVNLYPPLPPFDPRLFCMNDPDMNDSIELCEGACFKMLVYDAISNPTHDSLCLPTLLPYTTITNWSVLPVIPDAVICNAIHEFCPPSSGSFAIFLTLYRMNICDTDTFVLADTIHVTINPNPSSNLSIAGSPWLCPADSNLLVVSGGCLNAAWVGPGVTGNTNDSVWAAQPGSYSVSCIITNQFGCSVNASAIVVVQLKPQPVISIVSSNGVICPNDSVQLVSTGTGPFQWQGPGGPIGGNSNSVYVNQAGNYYCIITDSDSCALVSNTILVQQYATPYLSVSPNAVLCPGDSMVITVVAGLGSTVQWQFPLSGNSFTQTIYTPGTYTCLITSCGITTADSVTIGESIPVADITAAGSLTFCEGDSVLLTANSGMVNYVWNPGGISAQTYYAAQAGTYILTTTDSAGCNATDSISVTTYPNIATEPLVSDTLICIGESVTLTANGTGNIFWYESITSQNILESGNIYTTPILISAETYYVLSEDSGCRSARVPVEVTLENCDSVFIYNVFTPNNDGFNDEFYFYVPINECFKAKIYNRWGRLMYEWNDATKGWNGKNQNNGKPAADGVYYYILFYCSSDRVHHTAHGFLELLR